MNKKEVLEIKKRFTKNSCTFTKLCGCYIDGEKQKIVDISETFLNLEDEELYKYLDIAKKTLSGNIGNNLLELEFPLAEENPGGKQQFLMGLRESKLKNPDLLNAFYDLIIENYDYVGNYLILVFHDAYDVMTRTKDNNNLDESEEVFEYLICAICPVTLSKPGLGYRADENRIAARIQDWVVGAPETGFVFPAFTDRSTDIHSVMFYTKDTKAPHTELVMGALGCDPKRTATEQKITFNSLIENSLGEATAENEILMIDIQQTLSEMVEEHEAIHAEDGTDFILDDNTIQTLMAESQVPEEKAQRIETSFKEEFENETLIGETLIDSKSLEANAQKKEKMELVKEVAVLRQQLGEKVQELKDIPDNYDIVLKVKPEKVNQITSEIINGQKCIIIPVEDNEHTAINGEDAVV